MTAQWLYDVTTWSPENDVVILQNIVSYMSRETYYLPNYICFLCIANPILIKVCGSQRRQEAEVRGVCKELTYLGHVSGADVAP